MVSRNKSHKKNDQHFPCESCSANTSVSNLWALTLIIVAGAAGFLYWNQSQIAQARDYTDKKTKPILEVRDTVIEMEVNLKNYMEQQGYKYQEIQKKR